MASESHTYADISTVIPNDSIGDAVPAHRVSRISDFSIVYESHQDVVLAYRDILNTIPVFLVLNPSNQPYYTMSNTLLQYIELVDAPHDTVVDVETATPTVPPTRRLHGADRVLLVYICVLLICTLFTCLYFLVA